MMITSVNKTNAVFLFIIVFVMTGCISEKKMNKYVTSRYGETVTLKKIKSDYITISSPLLTDNNITSESLKKTKSFIPLLLYIRAYYQTSCTLNPKIPIN